MSARQLNTILWSLATLLACAALGVLAIGVLMPLQPSPAATATSVGKAAAAGANTTAIPSVESFEPVLNRSLRIALNDAGPAAARAAPAAAPATTAPAPSLVLVGTIGKSLAMIKTPDGNVALAGVGEQINGADVLAIRPTQVDVRIGGKTVTLEIPAETNDTP